MNGEEIKGDWTFGVHGATEALSASPNEVRRVVIAEGRRGNAVGTLATLAKTAGVRIERLPRRALDRLAKQAAFTGNHQGVAVERQVRAPMTEPQFEALWPSLAAPLVVVLDGIEDPRNLGACLRTAEAAGADAVLLPKRGSAPLSSAAAKAASGAMEHLRIVEVGNLARRLSWLREQGVWLVGGVGPGAGVPYTQIDYRGAVGIVVGGEQRGLRRLTRECCDHLVAIPMTGHVTSLNVSVALGVLLYEALRQRGTTEAKIPPTLRD